VFSAVNAPTPARITVVIASYKRPDAVAAALESLRAQTIAPGAFHVAVVVDGLDETESQYRAVLEDMVRVSSFQLRYEFQPNAGQSAARHRAIVQASTPWICVLDDDMELVPAFLAAHLDALERGGASTVVIGRVIPEPDWERTPLYEAVRTSHMLEWHTEMARAEREPGGFTLVTQNVSFGRELYLRVGGFDNALRLGEDSELGLRFEIAGARFVFSADAAAIHHSRIGSYDAWLRRCVEYGRSGVYIYEKLGRDVRAHPLRNFVNGSRANAAVVRAFSWSDRPAFAAIAVLRRIGDVLQRVGATAPAIATHKAILAIAYHVGVRRSLGSWSAVLDAARGFSASQDAPHRPT
jgi:GT2 family glycosyltransferase